MSNDLERAALADLVGVHRGWCNYCKGNADWCMERDCSLAKYLKALAPAQPEGWVSCSERLPEDGSGVLLYHNLGDVERPEVPHAIDVASYISGKWIFPWDRGLNPEPRWPQYWHRLPSPPSGGEQKRQAQAEGRSIRAETASRSPAPAVPDTLPEDVAWLHKFINCVPFGADAPMKDIHRAHSIVARLQAEGWDGQERRNAAPAKRWCTVTHTHQPHDGCDGTAAPAGEPDTLPEEPPELLTMRKYGGASTRRSKPIIDYIDRLQAELAEAKEQHRLASENAHMHYQNSVKWKSVAESAERRVGELGSLIVEAILSTTDEHTEQLLRDNCPEWDTWNRNALARGRD